MPTSLAWSERCFSGVSLNALKLRSHLTSSRVECINTRLCKQNLIFEYPPCCFTIALLFILFCLIVFCLFCCSAWLWYDADLNPMRIIGINRKKIQKCPLLQLRWVVSLAQSWMSSYKLAKRNIWLLNQNTEKIFYLLCHMKYGLKATAFLFLRPLSPLRFCSAQLRASKKYDTYLVGMGFWSEPWFTHTLDPNPTYIN